MNKRRISVNVQEQILIMREKNFGIRRTAKALAIARNTVLDFLRNHDEQKEMVLKITFNEMKYYACGRR